MPLIHEAIQKILIVQTGSKDFILYDLEIIASCEPVPLKCLRWSYLQ
jgi:hypothetical protein